MTGEDGEWRLYWTARDRLVPSRLVPVLSGWAALDQREDAADIWPGHPILIDPEFRLDPLLARFLGRSRLAWLAEGTRQAYAKDYRLFFSFLWQRGRYWHEADPDDLLDWEAWRRRDQQSGRGIGGSKWQRELAALRLVYDWAEKEQRIARSPVLVHQVRLRGGGTAMVADQVPRDVRSADVRWVTPRTYRLWRDVGLLGYDAASQPDPSWRGRNDGRKAAFTDLLFSSGLRLREGGCLLTLEVPDAADGRGYHEGTVAGAVAKRRQRMFYASAAALRRVAGYVATTRVDAVRRARRHRRYEQVPGKLIVTKISHSVRPKVAWLDEHGRAADVPLGAIGPAERMRLFTEGEDGLEPLWLWLGESGMPMAYESWEKVFDAANARVAAVLSSTGGENRARRTVKRAGWALVNLPTPDTLLERAATCRARQPGTATVASTAEHWRRYAAWLASRGINRLADIDAACHGQWAAHVARLPVAGRTRGQALNAVSVLWGMTPHLPAADHVPMPPWEAEGLRHYLPPDEGRNENSTAPVHPAVMSPLLTWALRFTEDFATDILTALAEHERLRSRIAARHNPDAAPRLAALLDEHARTGVPLPGETVKGRTCAAVSYLAGKTGASITQVGNALRRARLPTDSSAALGTPVTGQLCGKPWTGPISYHQAPALALRLSAACLIVVAYLSGLRPAELLHLQPGCCPAPADDGTGPVRYRLHGVKVKAARNDDGTPAPDGEARQWTVIPPVHTAIGILEQLTATSHLFPLRPPWLNGAPRPPRPRPEPSPGGGSRGRRRRTGQVITTGAANTRITEFITWVNAYAREHGLDSETIPDDPDGPVTLSRFRRTIAWHIARLPGGTVALAIQYGHLRTLTSEGYSGRSRHGLRDLLDLETARAMASYLQDVNDSLDSGGGGVSGPAARRLADAARQAASQFGPDPPAPRRPCRRAGEDRRTARPDPHHPGRRRCPPMSAIRSRPRWTGS